ncbi:MAG: amidohydrolase family protein [Actinomycetota bacterium]|uniref:amidohydrolase family protein n=1 Tax=Euzebya rosea TaxID=2052804 RepID=UPI000D3E121D|nr:amidohydrolase family protein [Euzebya rosea]
MPFPEPPPVVDCHVHVGATARWIPEGLELARETADEAALGALEPDGPIGSRVGPYLRSQGVTIGMAIPSGRGPLQEYTLQDAEESDGMLLPFVQYDPRSVTGAHRRFAAAIGEGAVGLKVHPASHQLPPNDRALYPLYAVAAEHRVPVMVHVGSSVFPGAKMRHCDPLLVDEAAVDFPEVNFLLAHSGRGFWTEQVFFLTRMRRNVWMELSGLPPRRLPEIFPDLDRVADRLLWGSDWPSSPPIRDLTSQLRQLPFRPATIDRLMWRNAAELFGLTGLLETTDVEGCTA